MAGMFATKLKSRNTEYQMSNVREVYFCGCGVFSIRQHHTLCVSTGVTGEGQLTAQRLDVTHSYHSTSDRNELAV